MSPSEQDNTSLKNELEITSAVSVCLVKSGIRIAHLIHFSPFDVMLAGNAVAPPKERPSLSKPAILTDSILVVVSPFSKPASILNSRYLSISFSSTSTLRVPGHAPAPSTDLNCS